MRKPFIVATLALGLVACNKSHESSSQPPAHEGASAEEGQPVKELVKDPEYGEHVTVEGKVDAVYGPQAFTMKAGIFQDDLLVVAPKELVIEALAAPAKVRVSGTVKMMVITEVEQDYAIDFDDAVEAQREAKPYVVVDSLQRID